MQRLLFFILILFNFGLAQTLFTGQIKNADTDEPLPAANIQIVGTLRGTITNENGFYYLELEKLPTTILVTYIGYESKKLELTQNSQNVQNIFLTPIILESEAIVVIAEDPAMQIMREVIKRKQIWRKKINNYKAEAYTRVVLENDSGIVSIAESISEAFWDREKGPREVIKSKRQTENLESNQNFAFSSHIPNFYDDDINIQGFKVIGPTHPDALDYYQFKLVKKRPLDKLIVFDIDVIPDSKLQPTFTGRISVIDSIFIMIDVNLKPNEKTMFYPMPIQEWNVDYKQQFSSFGQEFWLPVDIRSSGDIKVGMTGLEFPIIKYKRIARLTDYQVNIELPDSLYQKEELLTVDSTSLKADTIFATKKDIVPLSVNEQSAYENLDSTDTMEKAFRPTGFLADFARLTIGDEDEDGKDKQPGFFSGFAPQIRFNRVEALHAGFTYDRELFKNFSLLANLSYKTGLHRWGGGGGFLYYIGKDKSWFVKSVYQNETETRYESETYSTLETSILPLFASPDYFDYIWNESFRFTAGYNLSVINSAIQLGLNIEHHSSLEKTTDYNFLGSDFKQRSNPAIEKGNLRSLLFKLVYGDDFMPFGVLGQNRAEISIEHSSPDLFSSDFSFTKYKFSTDIRLNTFLTRRIFPNAFDFHITAGYSTGKLPLQRRGILDASLGIFSPFGSFKSLRGLPYEGEKYAALFWEHNFRTVPFELLGLRFLAEKSIGVILHGAHGKSWISNEAAFPQNVPENIHHEIGVSINGLLGFFRIDFTRRLDIPNYFVGVGLWRFLTPGPAS